MYLLLGVDIKHFPEFPSDVEFCSGKPRLGHQCGRLLSFSVSMHSPSAGTEPVLHSRRVFQYRQSHAPRSRCAFQRAAGFVRTASRVLCETLRRMNLMQKSLRARVSL